MVPIITVILTALNVCLNFHLEGITKIVAQLRRHLILPHFPDYNDGKGNATYTPPGQGSSPRRINAPPPRRSSGQDVPIAPIRYEYSPRSSQGSSQNRWSPPRENRYLVEEMPPTPTKSEHGKLRKFLKKLF